MKALPSGLPRAVIALGAVSLLTDLSSEMIYPLLPVFLAGVLGAGPAVLGVIEGLAETTASLLKIASGYWTDRSGRRKPLVLFGYTVSGACRPLIGLAPSWLWVLGLRLGDRVGKGLRTSPRDALIADSVDPGRRGAAFGFHRSMDHAGAVLGPLAAAGLLALGLPIRHVFLLAAVPALAAVATIVAGVPDSRSRPRDEEPGTNTGGELSPAFKRLLAALVVFTLGNSTDAFLLLRLAQAGIDPSAVALLWSAHHVVKMAATYLGGRASDRRGRRLPMFAGWLLYAAVYAGFAWATTAGWTAALFLVYGAHYGLTEPVERAWAADLSPAGLRGRAYGYYHGAVGVAALPASLLFGLLWNVFGAPAAFLAGAGLALAAALCLTTVPEPGRPVGQRAG